MVEAKPCHIIHETHMGPDIIFPLEQAVMVIRCIHSHIFQIPADGPSRVERHSLDLEARESNCGCLALAMGKTAMYE